MLRLLDFMECGGLAPLWIELVFALEFRAKLKTCHPASILTSIPSIESVIRTDCEATRNDHAFSRFCTSPKTPKRCQATALQKVQNAQHQEPKARRASRLWLGVKRSKSFESGALMDSYQSGLEIVTRRVSEGRSHVLAVVSSTKACERPSLTRRVTQK